MASSTMTIALQKIPNNSLPQASQPRPLRFTRTLCFSLFNTNTQLTDYDDTDRAVDVDRPPMDVFDPYSPTRSLSQVLNLMDQLMDNPLVAASRGLGSGSWRDWDLKEDDTALYLRMDMPGLGKKDVEVCVEQNTLIIKGEAGKASEEEEEKGRRYTSRLDLPSNTYQVDSIKAEMKNGVLDIMVPKVKEEERKDVFTVKDSAPCGTELSSNK